MARPWKDDSRLYAHVRPVHLRHGVRQEFRRCDCSPFQCVRSLFPFRTAHQAAPALTAIVRPLSSARNRRRSDLSRTRILAVALLQEGRVGFPTGAFECAPSVIWHTPLTPTSSGPEIYCRHATSFALPVPVPLAVCSLRASSRSTPSARSPAGAPSSGSKESSRWASASSRGSSSRTVPLRASGSRPRSANWPSSALSPKTSDSPKLLTRCTARLYGRASSTSPRLVSERVESVS